MEEIGVDETHFGEWRFRPPEHEMTNKIAPEDRAVDIQPPLHPRLSRERRV
jgi:hypothetical protein